jgi:hypothetical protein
MGSPISGFLAEIYLQQRENILIKHWLDKKKQGPGDSLMMIGRDRNMQEF